MHRRLSASPLRWMVPALLVVACDGSLPMGPFGPIPGRQLSGEVVREPVEDWSFADAFETYALETRPAQPYSVTTWGVADGRHFYVPTRDPHEKAWVQHVLTDSRVRLRVGDRIYERVAVRVTNPDEFKRILPLLGRKYDIDAPPDEEMPDVWLFSLEPR